MRTAQELTFVEVVRPVHPSPNVERLIHSARTFASLIFETDEAVAMVEVSDRGIVGDDGPTLVGAQPELCRVYHTDGLRLPLLERVTVPEARAGNSFSAIARAFREGRHPSKKLRQSPDHVPLPIERPIKEVLNELQQQAGHPDPDNLRLKLAKDIGYRYLGDLQNGSVDLMLIPDLGDDVTTLVHTQSLECFGRLEELSRGVAFPVSPQSLGIPFAKLSAKSSPDQRGRFIEQMRTALPSFLRLGEPRTSSHISS